MTPEIEKDQDQSNHPDNPMEERQEESAETPPQESNPEEETAAEQSPETEQAAQPAEQPATEPVEQPVGEQPATEPVSRPAGEQASAAEPEQPAGEQPAEAAPAPAAPEQPAAETARAEETQTPAEEAPQEAEQTEDEEDSDFGALLDQYLPESATPTKGEVFNVKVVAVHDDVVLVDYGGKEEAAIPIDEFRRQDGKPLVSVGDQIPVLRAGYTEEATPRLSHKFARTREAEKKILDAQKANVPIRGTVKQVVKGGLMIDVGLDAFMPASQVDLFKIPDLSTLLGQEIEAIVLEYDPRRKRAVLSRRQVLYERREQERTEFMKDLEPGKIVTGKVKNALDFGVFVNLGLIDGFIPRDEVSYDRGRPPEEIIQVGQDIEVKILNVQPETGKVTLSRKRLQDDPWDTIDERFPVGSVQTGRIVSLQSYGLFVHLEEGITGMIHIGDLTWEKEQSVRPKQEYNTGDEIQCVVLEIDKENRRLSLGYKQLLPDPWKEVEAKYPKGSIHKGEVTSVTNYGAFVKLDDFIEGLVHISDLTWDKRPKHPKEYVKVGDELEVKVLKIDSKQRRISLGVKQLSKSPFKDYIEDHPVGSVVKGIVTRFAPFGAFVELAPGLEGLVHISQIDEQRVELPEKALRLKEEILVKIIKVDEDKQKISLSRKEALKAAERENIRTYMKKGRDAKAGINLGEAIQMAQQEKKGEKEQG